jgi:cytochrome c553
MERLKINLIIVLTLGLVFATSCNTPKKDKTTDVAIIKSDSIAKNLLELKCMLCHNTAGKTEEQMIAPPFFAVRRQYLRFSMDEQDFKSSMRNYVLEPQADKAMMKGAIDKFGAMPKQDFDEKELEQIIDYIYKNPFPKPAWFDAHEAMHRKGIQH